MEILTQDALKLILDILPMPDKRNLLRCTTWTNKLNNLLPLYEKQFYDLTYSLFIEPLHIYRLKPLEKYTLEYTYYGYVNAMPKEYINVNNKILYFSSRICYHAGKNNYVELIKILTYYTKRYECEIMKGLAKGGHLETLKWCRTNDYEWNSDVCSNAALGGCLEVLKWLRENGCDWDSETCRYAAMNGNLEIIKWARDNSCSWGPSTCSYAALHGHLEVLQWARANGCRWNSEVCVLCCIRRTFNNFTMGTVKWMRVGFFHMF